MSFIQSLINMQSQLQEAEREGELDLFIADQHKDLDRLLEQAIRMAYKTTFEGGNQMKMTTSISIHVGDIKPEALVRENYTVINLESGNTNASLFFKNEEQLREFAEIILQQLGTKELAV